MNARVRVAAVAAFAAVAACAGILGIRPTQSEPFPHRKHVLQGISCAQCHTLAASSGADSPIDLPNTASCVKCHNPPHDARACDACHGREADRFAARAAKEHLRFSHAQHQSSTAGRCTRCHDQVATQDGPLRPAMGTCLSCHEHKQAWDVRNCGQCHVRMEQEGTRPESHVMHGSNFLARHGVEAASARDLCSSCHRDSDCALCHGSHLPALPSNWHFDDVRRPDMHPRGFLARHSLDARADPALCASCHRDQESCRSCHAQRGLLQVSPSQLNPHPPGWVGTRASENRHGLEARQNPLSCAACHGGAGESLCVGCHRAGGPGGNPHPAGFHSSKPLSDMPCRMCHTGGL